MIYKEIEPSQDLCSFVASYWSFKVEDYKKKEAIEHTILVDGCISLVFVSDPRHSEIAQVFAGPSIRNQEAEVYPGGLYTGIRFIPSMPYCLFGVSGLEIRNSKTWAIPFLRNIDFSEVLECISMKKDPFKKFDAILKKYINKYSPKPDSAVLKAVNDIIAKNGNIRIKDVVKNSPASERHLQRKFKKLTGLTLKEFARIRRLRASVIDMILRHKESGKAALDSGYFDQAHFNNDFSMIVGSNPSEFNAYIKHIEHINVD